jgi:hypothetical protein
VRGRTRCEADRHRSVEDGAPASLATLPVTRFQRDCRISRPDVEAENRAVMRLRAPLELTQAVYRRTPLLPVYLTSAQCQR